MRPSTRPGASPTHAVRRPRAAKKASTRSAASGAVPCPRVSSTSVAASSGGRAWKPTAPPPASSACSDPAAHSRATGPPCNGGPSGSAPASTSSHGTSPSASSWSRASKPACAARARAALRATTSASTPRHHEPALAAARGRPARVPRRPRAGTRTSRARSCGPGRPAATIRALSGDGRQRGSPKLSSWKESDDLVADVDADEVHQLEGPHAEAAARGDRRRSSRRRPRAPAGA